MGHRRFITIRDEASREDVDLEIPGDHPLGELKPILLKALWPGQSWQNYQVQLCTAEGLELSDDQSLEQAEVINSDILLIRLLEKNQPVDNKTTRQEQLIQPESRIPRELPQSPQDIRGNLPPREKAILQIDHPSLIDEKRGLVLVLGSSPIKIGRPKGAEKPDIDLSELDAGFATSRNHAEIHINNGKYVIRDQNSINGTFVNGEEIVPNSSYTLRDEDVILFGIGGPSLRFRLPEKKRIERVTDK